MATKCVFALFETVSKAKVGWEVLFKGDIDDEKISLITCGDQPPDIAGSHLEHAGTAADAISQSSNGRDQRVERAEINRDQSAETSGLRQRWGA